MNEINSVGGPADRFVKVVFELPRDDDGWPPVACEGLWAVPVTADTVWLHNSPWFVRGVANDDLIRVRRAEDRQLWADERLEWSGYCTIRIIPFREARWEGRGNDFSMHSRPWESPVRASSSRHGGPRRTARR